MNTIDLKDAHLRAKGLEPGPVHPEELEYARHTLRQGMQDITYAIVVVGLCGTVEDATLLEGYLQSNVYAEPSLKALCRYMDLTDRYRPMLREWMQNSGDDYRRMTAIHLAKEYFRDYEDDELGRYFIRVICDMGDECRLAVRGALVDILEIRAELSDPFGLNFYDWDEDTNIIAKAAASKFNYHDWKILLERARH